MIQNPMTVRTIQIGALITVGAMTYSYCAIITVLLYLALQHPNLAIIDTLEKIGIANIGGLAASFLGHQFIEKIVPTLQVNSLIHTDGEVND